MGKSTISMVIFNSYVKLPEGNWLYHHLDSPKNTLQFFPDLPHMNHRISIDLANKKTQHPPEKFVIKSHTMGCPQPILGILGSSNPLAASQGLSLDVLFGHHLHQLTDGFLALAIQTSLFLEIRMG